MNNKTTVLKELIEKMISNELRKQLPILLEELLTEQSTASPVKPSNINENNTSNLGLKKLLSGTSVNDIPASKPSSIPRQSKKYTSNPLINSILNETVNDLSLRESGRSQAVSLDGVLGTNYQVDQLNESTTSPPINNQFIPNKAESVLDFKGQNEAVDNLMKWDFKAILNKSKGIKH